MLVWVVENLHLPNISVTPFERCPQDWLQQQFSAVGQAWVSRDSVSMVYEGLSSAVPTGLLSLEKLRDSRVTRCMDKVLAQGLATAFEQAELSELLNAAPQPLNETQRAVDWFMEYADLRSPHTQKQD